MIQDETERRLAATTRERDQAFAKLRVLESKIQETEIEKGENNSGGGGVGSGKEWYMSSVLC